MAATSRICDRPYSMGSACLKEMFNVGKSLHIVWFQFLTTPGKLFWLSVVAVIRPAPIISYILSLSSGV